MSKGANQIIYLDEYLGNVGVPMAINATPFATIGNPNVNQIYSGTIPRNMHLGIRLSNESVLTANIINWPLNDGSVHCVFSHNWVIEIKLFSSAPGAVPGHPQARAYTYCWHYYARHWNASPPSLIENWCHVAANDYWAAQGRISHAAVVGQHATSRGIPYSQIVSVLY